MIRGILAKEPDGPIGTDIHKHPQQRSENEILKRGPLSARFGPRLPIKRNEKCKTPASESVFADLEIFKAIEIVKVSIDRYIRDVEPLIQIAHTDLYRVAALPRVPSEVP